MFIEMILCDKISLNLPLVLSIVTQYNSYITLYKYRFIPCSSIRHHTCCLLSIGENNTFMETTTLSMLKALGVYYLSLSLWSQQSDPVDWRTPVGLLYNIIVFKRTQSSHTLLTYVRSITYSILYVIGEIRVLEC